MRARVLTTAVLAAALAGPPWGGAAQAVPLVSSPNVSLLASFPHEAGATGGLVLQRGGRRWFLMNGAQGVSVYDATVPELPLLAFRLPLPHWENEDLEACGNLLLVSQDPAWFTSRPGGTYILDISMLPVVTFAYVNPATGNRFRTGDPYLTPVPEDAYVGDHTISFVRPDCSYAYGVGSGGGSNRINVIDLRDPAHPRLAGRFTSPVGATHDVQMDAEGIPWMVGSGGWAALDTTDPLNPRVLRQGGGLRYHHNSQRRGGILLVTEEDWLQPGCANQGRFGAYRIEDGALLDTWTPAFRLGGGGGDQSNAMTVVCSAHYFDERGGLVAIAWYNQGTRILDVSDPAHIRQVGYFVPPNATTWAARWISDDVVYTLDVARGLEVLRVNRGAPSLELSSPPPGAGGPTLVPHPTWGYACAIPAR